MRNRWLFWDLKIFSLFSLNFRFNSEVRTLNESYIKNKSNNLLYDDDHNKYYGSNSVIQISELCFNLIYRIHEIRNSSFSSFFTYMKLHAL